MVTLRRAQACVAIPLFALIVGGCATTRHPSIGKAGASTSHPTPAPRSASSSTAPTEQATAPPTLSPCVYPDASGLQNLELDSNLVVTATINSAVPVPSTPAGAGGQSVPTFAMTSVKVLARNAAASTTLPTTIVSYWPLTPGKYLFFLGGAENNSPVGGLNGMFRVSGNTLLLSCTTLDSLTSPVAAAGTPPTVAAFVAAIPSVLPAIETG